MAIIKNAKYNIGQAVRHKAYDFAGIIEDVDPVFAGTDDWFDEIPVENRPDRDQPFYRLRVDHNGEEAVAYVSEQNLIADVSGHDLPVVSATAGEAGAGAVAIHLH